MRLFTEKNVFLGGLETIKRNKPVLLVEIEQKHTNKPVEQTINFIKSHNYNAFVYRNIYYSSIIPCDHSIEIFFS